MAGMERRRNKRLELTSRLIIKRLDNPDEQEQEVAIEVSDVSKTGLGFYCTIPLEIGAVYEAYLTIWTKEVIHAFVEIVRIEKDEDAFKYSKVLGEKEGILSGISSGANLAAAIIIAKKLGKGKRVITILPDTGERYLSTTLFTGE